MDHLSSGTYKRFKSLIDAVAVDRAAGSNVPALGPSVGDDNSCHSLRYASHASSKRSVIDTIVSVRPNRYRTRLCFGLSQVFEMIQRKSKDRSPDTTHILF